MDPLPSINKIYSMAIQEGSNNISFLPKPGNSHQIEESNTLINAYDARKCPDRGKNHMHPRYKKDIIICTHCNITGYNIELCYIKHGFPPHFGKTQI